MKNSPQPLFRGNGAKSYVAGGGHVYPGILSVTSSTSLVTQLPNVAGYVTDATIGYSWTCGLTTCTVTIWYDNGTSATDATLGFGNGTTINLGNTTSGSPSYSASGVSAGESYYAVLHYQNKVTTLVVQTSPFTITQMMSYIADGGIVVPTSSARAALFTTHLSSSGSATFSGGGGGHNL